MWAKAIKQAQAKALQRGQNSWPRYQTRWDVFWFSRFFLLLFSTWTYVASKEKVCELQKNQFRMGCVASFPFPGLLGSTFRRCLRFGLLWTAPWFCLRCSCLIESKQIGSLWPSLAAFSRAYETKLLQVRVRKQGRTWRRTWQEGGKDLSNDLLVRFRICRFQSSKKKNCGYFFVPIVAKKAPAVWCHFSSSRTSRLALKFLKMKLMMKAFYRLEIASRRPQLGADGRGTQAAWWGFQNERRVVCPFLVPISFQTKPRLRVAEQVDLCKFYEGLSLFSEGPRASSKRVPGRVPLTRELGLGYSLVVSLFKFEADMSRCLCYLKQLWSSKYWSPKTIGVSDQGWLWQWQTRLKIKYSIVMFLSWVLVGLVTYFCFKRS